MYVLEWQTVSAVTRELFSLFPELRSNEGNKHQNNNRVSTETVCHGSTYSILFLTRLNESINAVWKIGRNHGWSNGPPMVALWVVRSILGGLLKIRVNLKLLHRWHMDFKMFSFVDYTLLCWKLILNKIKASWKTLGTKNLGRPTDHLGGLLGRPDDL